MKINTNYQTYKRISILFLSALFLLFPLSADNKQNFGATNLSTKILNSERIELKYGNYHIEVLKSDNRLRVSNLYSEHNAKKVTRTFAIVSYPSVVEEAFASEHTKVLAGGSMGATFKKNGWKITKKSIYRGSLPASTEYQKLYQLMGDIQPTPLAIYIYHFCIQKGEKKFNYAGIAEIYHPDYLAEENLEAMYSGNFKKNKVSKQMLKDLQDYLKENK